MEQFHTVKRLLRPYIYLYIKTMTTSSFVHAALTNTYCELMSGYLMQTLISAF